MRADVTVVLEVRQSIGGKWRYCDEIQVMWMCHYKGCHYPDAEQNGFEKTQEEIPCQNQRLLAHF